MSIPLIGITTNHGKRDFNLYQSWLNDTYVHMVCRAGAAPVLIPADIPSQILGELLKRLDGLIFSGGGDIDPSRYGGYPDDSIHGVDDRRDRLEIELVTNAIQTGMPFLGICRGLQIINVAMGGSLYEDIQKHHPNALAHSNSPISVPDRKIHQVEILNETQLAELLHTPQPMVNSSHHQAIRTTAPGLHISAIATDGIIEAIEVENHPFGIAVQWHPERLPDEPESKCIFEAFSLACRSYGSQK